MRWILVRDFTLVFLIGIMVVVAVAVAVAAAVVDVVWVVTVLEFMNGQCESKVPMFFGTIQPPADLWVV